MSLGSRLQEERKRLGLNQSEFADMAGVQISAQTNYETGKRQPDAAYLSAIAAAGADVLYILTGERQEGLGEAGKAMYKAMLLAGVDLQSVARMVQNDKAYARRLEDCVPIMHTLANCTDEDVQLIRQLVTRLRQRRPEDATSQPAPQRKARAKRVSKVTPVKRETNAGKAAAIGALQGASAASTTVQKIEAPVFGGVAGRDIVHHAPPKRNRK
jgi:transcriptional regulator with XRE-family HTH domain